MKSTELTPHQIPEIKAAACNVAHHISLVTGRKMLSAFKRNDLTANCLGYKGFSDLEQTLKRKVQINNTSIDFWLQLDNPKMKQKFIDVFCTDLIDFNIEQAAVVFSRIEKEEALKIRITKKNTVYFINAPDSNTYSELSTALFFPLPSQETEDYIDGNVERYASNLIDTDQADDIRSRRLRAKEIKEVLKWHASLKD